MLYCLRSLRLLTSRAFLLHSFTSGDLARHLLDLSKALLVGVAAFTGLLHVSDSMFLLFGARSLPLL